MTRGTNHARVALPPPLVYLGYLLSALLLQWIVPVALPWPVPIRILGGFVLLGGFLLAAAAIREMRKMRTTPDPRQPVTALVTHGPYRFTRNPIYLGFLLIYFGFTFLADSLWGMLLSPFLIGTITRWVIHAEEVYLIERFPGEYQAYLARVRQWLYKTAPCGGPNPVA